MTVNTACAPPVASPALNVGEDRLTLIVDGPERLRQMLAMIDGATRILSLISYTFLADRSGQQIIDALIRAARRGVTIRVMIDSFGSSATPDDAFDGLRNAGGEIFWFSGGWGGRYLIRNHQKLLVVDGRIAMTGGFNIADSYFAAPETHESWHDIGLLIEGPTASLAARWARALHRWMKAPKQRWRSLTRLIRRFHGGHGATRLLIGGPTPRLSPLTRAFRLSLRSARDIAISTAYFAPNANILRALAGTRRRGGATQLVLPAYSDNGATVGASRLLYGYLLKRRVAIAEFEAAMLHNKIYVLDDVVYIGSANLDMRSLYINLELVLRIEDAAFAQACRQRISDQLEHSTPISASGHKASATWLTRLRWLGSWLVVAVLDYGVTRRLNFGLPRRK